MTIICALHEPGVGTWIGADTRVSFGATPLPAVEQKWVIGERWSVAVTGNSRARALLLRGFRQWSGRDMDAQRAADAMRALLREDGWNDEQEKGDPVGYDINALIASPTFVGLIGRNFVVTDLAGAFFSVGSGAQYALGAFHALRQTGETDCQRILAIAIDAACRYDTGCGGEPYVHLLRAA